MQISSLKKCLNIYGIFNESCKSLEDVVSKYETSEADKLESVLRTEVYEKMLLKMKQRNIENDEK